MNSINRLNCRASLVIRLSPDQSPFVERSLSEVPLPLSELVSKVLAEYGLSAIRREPTDLDLPGPPSLDLLA
jgi:hypothetical protein